MESTIMWEMCYVKGGGTPEFIFTILNILKQHIITFLNRKFSWKMMTLLENLQMKIFKKKKSFQKEMQKK
jgi:hypothetical protein